MMSLRPIVWITFLTVAIAQGRLAFASNNRVALVIGNSEYEHVSNLPNPANDATDIAAALERIGFDVTRGMDLDYRAMRLALRDFADAAEEAEMVVVYFAGHGIEIDNTNYLIPVNAELRSDRDVEFEAIRLDTVVTAVANVDGLKVILIDACRNNPFLSDMVRTSATRSIGRGLGRIDPGGVLVGYAARGGTLASDGDGRNSPYAQALLRHIEEPGLELGKMFRKVRDTVFELTDGYQEPFTYGSLPGEDIYLVPAAAPAPPTAPVFPGPEIAAAFALADTSATIEGWNEFLNRFAEFETHPLVTLAAQRRDALQDGPTADPIGTAATEIENELELYAAAEKIATPRGWALYFDRYPTGRLTRSALVREDDAFMSDLRARVFGRYRNAFDGEEMTSAMVTEALKMQRLTEAQVRQMQEALTERGNDVGGIDGRIGPRTRTAIRNFQRGRGLPVNGVPTRATLAALRIGDAGAPMADLYPTSGAIARVTDVDVAMALEQDPRLERFLATFRGQPVIYGYFESRLYGAVYMGTTFGEGDLATFLERAGGQLVEFDTRAEEEFVFDLVRYDRKMWHNNEIRVGEGPSIGLGRGTSGWQWRSGKPLGYTNWVPGEPQPVLEQGELRKAYGRLVPKGNVPRNATRLDRAGWAVGTDLSPAFIVEIE